MSEVLVVKPGSLSRLAKADLRKAKIVVVETDDPTSVRFLTAEREIEGGQMLSAALKALDKAQDWNGSSKLFTKLCSEFIDGNLKP